MSRENFRSERHAALAQTFPPEAIDKLLSSGAMEGPSRKTRPYTITWRIRLTRFLRRFKRGC